MKLNSFFICLLVFAFCLSSCVKMPNMSELLAYEHENMRFILKITDEKEFSAVLVLDKENDILTFTDEALSGISVEFGNDGAVHLRYEDYKIPLPNTSLLKAIRWKELFHLSGKNLLWKIQKETLGGLAVYVCRADDVTVYIDAGTYLPLKITQGKLVIDVLESENLSPVEPKE